MKSFDAKYNDLPKTELHIHLEGSIRTQTIIDIAKEYHLKLPSYEASELDRHVKVYEQMRNLGAVLEAFAIFQNSITSPETLSCLKSAFRRIGLFMDMTCIGTPALKDSYAPKIVRKMNLTWQLVILPSLPEAWVLSHASKQWIGRSAIKNILSALTWRTVRPSTPSMNS
jgi:hypothetical protein